jgi:hypothetical protein
LEWLRTLIEHPIRESLSEKNELGEGVLRVVRAHVLAHAPGNAFARARIVSSRRPA